MASKNARLRRRQENRKRRARNEARAAARAAAQGRADELEALNAAHDAGKATAPKAAAVDVDAAHDAGQSGDGERTEPGKAGKRAAEAARKARELDAAAGKAAKRLAEQQRIIDDLPGHEKDRKTRKAGKTGASPADDRSRREGLRRNVTRVVAAVVGVATLIGVAAAGIVGGI